MIFLPGFLYLLSFQLMLYLLSFQLIALLLQLPRGRAHPTSHMGESWGKGQKSSMPSIISVLRFLQHAGSSNHFLGYHVLLACPPCGQQPAEPANLTPSVLHFQLYRAAHEENLLVLIKCSARIWEKFYIPQKRKATAWRNYWYIHFLVLA